MKKKTKKIKTKFKLILLFIILIIIGIIILKIDSKTLKGTKLDDYIYKYSIKDKKDNYVPIQVKDNNIYYLIDDNQVYNLYNRNIYNRKDTLIGKTNEKMEFCSLDDNYIHCANNKKNYYYDYNFKLLYDIKNNELDTKEIIYYQGKFLKLSDKELYENDKLFRKIELDNNDTNFYGEFITNNNTYLIFFSNANDTYYYYDILNNKYNKRTEYIGTKYNQGHFTIKDDKILVYDLINNKYDKYPNSIINENVRTYLLKDKTLYFIENNCLYSIDLNTNEKINIFEYKLNTEINQIQYDDNFIYLISYTDNYDNEITVIDINNTSKVSFTFNEYEEYMDELIDDKVSELEKRYHVDIRYKDEVKISNKTFKTTEENNSYILISALDTIESVLNKFNYQFFDKFKDDIHSGLTIYLSGEIIPVHGANTASNPVGYTLTENNEFEIVADISKSLLKNTICHELMHNTEYRMTKDLYSEWFKKNPKSFSYLYSYTSDTDNKYTTDESDVNNVYFIDSYSKTYPTEDIARIFENICSKETDSIITKYPHLLDKALYLKEELEKDFPSLKIATVFDSIKTK